MFTAGMSRLGVGLSVMVALSVALFLTVLLLLLADLFCSHLRLRAAMAPKRPKHGGPASSTPPHTATADDASVATTATTTTTHEALSSTPPFYYAHGVMSAPNPKDLLLAIPRLEAAVWRWSPARGRSSPSRSGSTCGSSAHSDGFMCISNPVYERGGAPAAAAGGDTPFKTPDSSPSPCGITEEEEEGELSPPLSMMRKLPPLGVLACPPPELGFLDGRPSLAAWSARSGTVTDTNRASSSSSNLTTHFFSS